jgi:8-oxo-dGTP diphosphatase
MSTLDDSHAASFRLPADLAPTEADRACLLRWIRRLSLKRGRFVLSSGALSDYYLDLRLATTHPAAARLAARFLLAEVAHRGANRLGGPTLGADPLVGAAVSLVPTAAGVLGGFMVRPQAKDHGTGRQIEGHLGAGDRALVFDDVVTAGGSILRAVDAVRAAGAEVTGSWCLVDRDQGGRDKLAEAGAPLTAVFPVREVLEAALPDGPPEEPIQPVRPTQPIQPIQPIQSIQSTEPAQPIGPGHAAGAEERIDPAPAAWRPITPVLAADAIMEPVPGCVLLIRRKNPPLGWALPGGFVEVGESVEEAVRREILEETGLTLGNVMQMHTYSAPGRDPRLPTVTVIFAGRASGTPVAGDDAAETRLFTLDALPPDLCFDHRQVLEDYRTARYGVGSGTLR